MKKCILTLFALTFALHGISQKQPKLNLKRGVLSDFVKIPEGELFSASSKRELIPTFYISKGEVTNLQYRTFLNEIKENVSVEEYSQMLVDSAGWRDVLHAEPYTQYYFSHPAYNQYPCVNVSHSSASAYCNWLALKLTAENPTYTFEVRLPSRTEWEYSARGGKKLATYPWGGPYILDRKGRKLCNYKASPDARLQGKDEDLVNSKKDNADMTAPSLCCFANDFGVYNTSGNVSEMVSDTSIAVGGCWMDDYDNVKNNSFRYQTTPSPTVGFRPLIFVSSK